MTKYSYAQLDQPGYLGKPVCSVVKVARGHSDDGARCLHCSHKAATRPHRGLLHLDPFVAIFSSVFKLHMTGPCLTAFKVDRHDIDNCDTTN
jgi:hypothetical protein